MSLIGPEVSYIDLLDDKLHQKAEAQELALKNQDKSKLKHPLRPSSAGECERALTYRLMEYAGHAYYDKQVIEPRISRIFALGHSIEAMLLDLFEEVEYLSVAYKQQTLTFFNLSSQKDPSLNVLVEGSNDGCFIGKRGEFKCVFDVKSKATGIGKFKKTKWEEQDAIFDDMKSVQRFSDTGVWVEDLSTFLRELDDDMFAMNFWQLNLYLNSQFMKERGFDHGSIIQFSKDDSKMREIRFKPSAELAKQVGTRFQNVINAVADRNVNASRREFNLGSSKCAFCTYNKQCWGEDSDALKSYFKAAFPNKKQLPAKLDLSDSLSKMIVEFALLEAKGKEQTRLKKEIIQECMKRGLDKVQVGGLIYELKQLKTTIEFKRGKI